MKPDLNDIPEFYQPYIKSLPEKPLILLLQNTLDRFNQHFSKLDENHGDFKYQSGKWTIKQMVQHL